MLVSWQPGQPGKVYDGEFYACFIKLSVGYMSRMLRYLAFVVISSVLSFFLMLGSSPDVLPP